ncbi:MULTISPECIES: hypothetical protein [Aneurinibacillus]|uniref:hypothetical protein n=1 Tax=Aneurinibacillus TaxID=55079 RepID=UPI0012E38F06|nr:MULTISPECIES: hypothetical protein [Aneurinibacillus]MED0680829.1 hypothetical protein [Aneurinibacillus thermoaerophilus]
MEKGLVGIAREFFLCYENRDVEAGNKMLSISRETFRQMSTKETLYFRTIYDV